jgi:hypothetical protein
MEKNIQSVLISGHTFHQPEVGHIGKNFINVKLVNVSTGLRVGHEKRKNSRLVYLARHGL